MKRVNQYHFYQMGATIHPVTELLDEATFRDAWYVCFGALQSVETLLADKLTPLLSCRSGAIKLRDALKYAVPTSSGMTPEQYQEKLAKPLGEFYVWQIRNAAREFEILLSGELETTDTYYVSQKGIYATHLLIEKAEMTFTDSVRSQLSAQAINDIQQSGKALAFDLDTACGFHIVRATETIIHKYYETVTGTTPKRKDRNWGAYVRNLNAHIKNNPNSQADRKLISLIDQVREHHRNPVIHPEITLTPEESQGLFSICQAVIMTFAAALRSLTATQLTLKVVGVSQLNP